MEKGIIHFITPETRRKLFEIVYNAYWIKAREEKPKEKGARPVVNKAMAMDLGVSTQTIKAWKAGRSHGSDECVLKLLEKALELRPEETLEALRDDLRRHKAIVEAIEARYAFKKPEERPRKEAKEAPREAQKEKPKPTILRIFRR